MAATQLTATTVPGRSVPTFEGLRPSTVKIASFVPLKQGLSQRCFRPLVVKAVTVVAPMYTSIRPLADRVLVKIKESEEETPDGIFIPKTLQPKPQFGEVVAIGEGKSIGKHKIEIGVKPGTQVVYSKYAGTEVLFNGANHLLLKEDEIVGILEKDDIKDLKPLNDRVLIKVAEAEDKTSGGVLLAATSKEKPSIGTVIAVGPGPLDQQGNRQPLSFSPGDTVLFFRLGGNDFQGKDGSDYMALRASDVLAVLSS